MWGASLKTTAPYCNNNLLQNNNYMLYCNIKIPATTSTWVSSPAPGATAAVPAAAKGTRRNSAIGRSAWLHPLFDTCNRHTESANHPSLSIKGNASK
jgi:hypothetical protein